MFKLDLQADYYELYRTAVSNILSRKEEIFGRIDELLFLKMASQLKASDSQVQASAKQYLLKLYDSGKLELPEDKLRQFIVDTTPNNLDAVAEIDKRIKARGRQDNQSSDQSNP